MRERLESRSEKRLHKRLRRAVDQRQRQLEAGKFSAKSGEGKLSIIISSAVTPDTTYASKGREPWYFRLEAECLKEQRSSEHQEVLLRERGSADDVKTDLADPDVTDIIFVGNGTINALFLSGDKYFTWWDAARASTALKQGRVEQRMCGHFPPDVPYHVPLGTFAVSDLRNVTAATGMVIPDRDPADELFQPVFSSPEDPIGQIQDLNERFAGKPPAVIGDNRQLASI